MFFFQVVSPGSLLRFLLGDSCGFSWVTRSVSYLPTAYVLGILDSRVPVLTGSTTRLYHTYLVLYNVPWPKAYEIVRRGLTNQEKSIPLPITLPTTLPTTCCARELLRSSFHVHHVTERMPNFCNIGRDPTENNPRTNASRYALVSVYREDREFRYDRCAHIFL